MSDYYQILGISRLANQSEVKKAFRYKAKNLHPDVNRNAAALREFHLVNEAYQVLGNREKRRIYDLRLHNGIPSQKVYYKPGKVKYRAKGDRYAHYNSGAEAGGAFEAIEKYFDLALFISLVFIGCFALFYGIYRLWIRPHDEINPLPGIVLGIFFTGLIIFVWRTKNKIFKS